MARRIKQSVFKIQSDGMHFYVTVMSGKKLFSLSEVSRAVDDPEDGYQRHLSQKRRKDIAEYIDSGNLIPGAVIVSAQKEAKLKYDSEKHIVTFEETKGAFLVIDGQHRLYGVDMAEKDIDFIVTIFDDLDTQVEVQYFLDVNSTQRGVPKTLQLEIMKFTVEEDSPEKVRIRLFKELSENPQSPLCGKMSAAKGVPGKLTHVPFKSAIDPLFEIEAFAKAPFEKKTTVLINFLNATERVLSEVKKQDKLTNAAFFKALFSSFRTVLNIATIRHKSSKEAAFYDVLLPLRHIDWDSNEGTNNAAISKLSSHIISLIESAEITDLIL